MGADFRLIAGRTAQEVLEVQLNKPVGAVGLEIEAAIGLGLRQCGHKTLHGQITIDEQSLNRWALVQLHQIAIAKHLAIGSANNVACVLTIKIGRAGERGCCSHGLRGEGASMCGPASQIRSGRDPLEGGEVNGA